MMCGRHGERLDDWLTAVEADDLPNFTGSSPGSGATTTLSAPG
jgi:hypothetical protein